MKWNNVFRIHLFVLCLFLILIMTYSPARAQLFMGDPRFIAGGSVGTFRISLDRFEEVYDGRWGNVYGWLGSVRLYSRVYLTVSGRSFEKSGRSGIHEESGLSLQNAKWKEQWYLIGLRRWGFRNRGFGTYATLGFALFYIEEVPPTSVFEFENTDTKKNGNGFFINLGLEYSILPRFSIFGEIEVSSAGVGGRSGFEGSSIGGFYFSTGAYVRLF